MPDTIYIAPVTDTDLRRYNNSLCTQDNCKLRKQGMCSSADPGKDPPTGLLSRSTYHIKQDGKILNTDEIGRVFLAMFCPGVITPPRSIQADMAVQGLCLGLTGRKGKLYADTKAFDIVLDSSPLMVPVYNRSLCPCNSSPDCSMAFLVAVYDVYYYIVNLVHSKDKDLRYTIDFLQYNLMPAKYPEMDTSDPLRQWQPVDFYQCIEPFTGDPSQDYDWTRCTVQ